MASIASKAARARLKARREPYWHRLEKGQYLGFRAGADTWIVRFRDRTGRQQYHALGETTQLPEYDDAKRAAEGWLKQLAGAPVRAAKRGSVREALEAYLADLRREGRSDTATEAEGRFKVVVWPDPLADIQLETLTRDDVMDWRDRLREGRLNRSLNRHVRTVIAGLNRAQSLGHVGNPASWKLTPLADDVEDDGETAVFLTPAQRAAIIAAAAGGAGEFFRGLELTGARPGELAKATVKDLNGDTLKLSHRKGRPAKLRSRAVILSMEGAAFFKAQAKGKLPGAYLFAEDGARQWKRYRWSRRMRAAIDAANRNLKGKDRIPHEASAYSFRHARISELLQDHGVDPLTVAAQTGTSLAMMEKAYWRLVPNAMREKLNAVTGRRV